MNRGPWSREEQIPNVVIGVLGDAIGSLYSHTKINTLFMECAFPGDAPGGNCVEKCRSWMRAANSDPSRPPLDALGELLGGFLTRMPPDSDDRQTMWTKIEQALARSNLHFDGQQTIETLGDNSTRDARTADAPTSSARWDHESVPLTFPNRPAPSFIEGTTVDKAIPRIFIGHGRSIVWKDLKDFLTERLKLEYEEFNREPTAGLSTKERLLQILNKCQFAFLLMTAEDEHADGSKHARENVVHEIGLFQGRYGFERAIVLLEQGCEEFSNITGTGQIRYPSGNIEAKFEEIRRVLEREHIL